MVLYIYYDLVYIPGIDDNTLVLIMALVISMKRILYFLAIPNTFQSNSATCTYLHTIYSEFCHRFPYYSLSQTNHLSDKMVIQTIRGTYSTKYARS